MFGPSGFIIIGLAVATAVALLLLIAFGAFPGMVRTVARSFWCPFLSRRVTAEFREEAWDGAKVAVTRCTAFTPPTAITCGRRCLGLRRFPSSPEAARHA